MHRRDAQKVLRKALRPEWPGFDEAPGWSGDARGGGVNNAERAAIAEAVLGLEVKRLTLAWLVAERARSAYAESLDAAGGIDAFGVDALEEVLRGERLERLVGDSEHVAYPPFARRVLPRARYVAAAGACSTCTGCASAWRATSSGATASPCRGGADRGRRGPPSRPRGSPRNTPCLVGSRSG